MVNAGERRQGVEFLMSLRISLRRACDLAGIGRSSFKYLRRRHEDKDLISRIREIAGQCRRYGYRRIWAVLRREGVAVNHKRIRRICRQLNLVLPKRAIKKRRQSTGAVPCRALFENHVWTYDFVFDNLASGRQLKILTLVDEFTRIALAIHIGTSIKAKMVIEILERLFAKHGTPRFLRSDNGPEFIAKALQAWLRTNGSETMYIVPGSPWENAYIESFNGKLRDECLNMELFRTMAEAYFMIEKYRDFYNNERPHSSLHYLTPMEFKTGLLSNTVKEFQQRQLSLSHGGTPDGQSNKNKRQSQQLCPSVCSPEPALESLSSVALSSGQAIINISSRPIHGKNVKANPGN